jgi:HSP20 family protein
MSDDEWWSRWFRKGMPPFFKGLDMEDIDEAFEEMEKEFRELMKKTPKNLVRERRLPDGSRTQEWGPFVYGYSITVGPDGKPHIREFGNVKPELGSKGGKPRLDIKDEREPLVDVTTTDSEVKVIAELPGVEKTDIQLKATDDSLTVSVDNPGRRYFKRIDLPAKVDPQKTRSSYKNGILEVSLPKKDKGPLKGEDARIV